MSVDPERIKRLQAQVFETFREETREGLGRLETELLHLRTGASRELVDELFRVVHTIKGSAGSFGLRAMGALAHQMEAYFEQLRNGAAPSADGLAALLEGRDALSQLLDAPPETDVERYRPLLDRLQQAASNRDSQGASATAGAPQGGARSDTHAFNLRVVPTGAMFVGGVDPALLVEQYAGLGRMSTTVDTSALPPLRELDPDTCYLSWQLELHTRSEASSLDAIFSWLSDVCTIEVQPVTPKATPVAATSPAAEPAASVRVGIDKLDALMNLVGELVIVGSGLSALDHEEPGPDTRRRSREALARLARLTRGMHERVLSMRSLPVGLVFHRFPRMVHDLSTRLGKQVALELQGETTEFDKTVLERLGDPLVHLVRNSLDHGLEGPEERAAAGKGETGTITLAARQQGHDVIITVADDGRGLDPAKIFAAAVRKGVVNADAKLSVPEIQRLILAPGFSTAESVSDISGRGVGMDVVANSIREIGGDLQVESVVGEGTTVTLRLPLTLAIIEGQLVRFADRPWVLPLQSISECVRLEQRHLSSLLGRGLVYDLRGETLPVLDPCVGFGLAPSAGGKKLVMVLESASERVALLVDEVGARQQVVVKSMEQHMRPVNGLSGATVLGDGTVAFILDVARVRDACPVALPPHPASEMARA